ncbi:MAG: cyclic nucleotide-binding domain-containing protein [Planctomycetaceae bacterium]
MSMLSADLTSLQIFSGLEDEDAKRICRALQNSHYDQEQTILNEGDSVQVLWIILQGECVVTRSCGRNDDYVLAELKAGDVFGEMSFIRTAPHSASIKAKTDVTACCYRREDFMELLTERPHAAWRVTSNIAAVLAERLRRMDNWVCDLVDGPNGHHHRDEWQSFRSAVYTNWSF